jgi:type VI secretion system secreted protein VgrG
MEVAVGFVEGDPDKPVLLGALFNGRNGALFPLPQERSRSGLRTQTVGGSGGNELSFEDAAGAEQVLLRAQRDLSVVVENDRATVVKRDQTLVVAQDARARIERRREDTIGEQDSRTVLGDALDRVMGSRVEQVDGGSTLMVEGGRQELLNHTAHRQVALGETHVVGADLELVVSGNSRSLTGGRHTVVVDGVHDALFRKGAAISSTGPYDVAAARTLSLTAGDGLRLTCGAAVIELRPDEVLISAPKLTLAATDVAELLAPDTSLHLADGKATLDAKREARVAGQRAKVFGKDAELDLGDGDLKVAAEKTVEVSAQGAALLLDTDAALLGSKVKLKSDSGPAGSYEDAKPDKLATSWIEIRLVRKEPVAGQPDATEDKPVPGARYIVEAAQGRVYTGVLDGEGRARVMVPPGHARVRFPDFDGDAIAPT